MSLFTKHKKQARIDKQKQVTGLTLLKGYIYKTQKSKSKHNLIKEKVTSLILLKVYIYKMQKSKHNYNNKRKIIGLKFISIILNAKGVKPRYYFPCLYFRSLT